MKGSDGKQADSHDGLIAQQHGAYPLLGLHTDTLDTPTNSVPYAPTRRPILWQPTFSCRARSTILRVPLPYAPMLRSAKHPSYYSTLYSSEVERERERARERERERERETRRPSLPAPPH